MTTSIPCVYHSLVDSASVVSVSTARRVSHRLNNKRSELASTVSRHRPHVLLLTSISASVGLSTQHYSINVRILYMQLDDVSLLCELQ